MLFVCSQDTPVPRRPSVASLVRSATRPLRIPSLRVPQHNLTVGVASAPAPDSGLNFGENVV